MKLEASLSQCVEGETFALSFVSSSPIETPGRIALHVISHYGSSLTFYFDKPDSLERIAAMFQKFDAILMEVGA